MSRFTIVAVLLVVFLLTLTCSKEPTSSLSSDKIPPARIRSLNITDSTATSVTVYWRAVGDDSLTGTASAYDLRVSTTVLTENNWSSATVVPQHIAPGRQGIIEHFTITGLDSTKGYYIAIKAIDDAGNASALSNVVKVNVREVPIDPRLLWLSAVGNSPNLEPVSVAIGPDESVFLLATVLATGWDLLAMKLDSNGHTIWSAKLGGGKDDYGADIIPSADGGCFVTGTTTSFGDTTGDGYIVALDASGRTVWSATVGVPGGEFITTAAQCADGGFALAGRTTVLDTIECSLLIRTDAAGHEVWRKSFYLPNTCTPPSPYPPYSYVTDVQIDRNGLVIVNAVLVNISHWGITCGPPQAYCQLSSYDASGNWTWERIYADDSKRDVRPGTFVILPDGSYATVVVKSGEWGDAARTLLRWLPDGTTLYSSAFPEFRWRPYPSVANRSGSYFVMVTGTISEDTLDGQSTGPGDMLVLVLAENGTRKGCIKIGEYGIHEEAYCTAVAPDEDVFVLGTRQVSPGEQSLLVAKVRLLR